MVFPPTAALKTHCGLSGLPRLVSRQLQLSPMGKSHRDLPPRPAEARTAPGLDKHLEASGRQVLAHCYRLLDAQWSVLGEEGASWPGLAAH